VQTLHGSQFRDVGLIVASPPCQAYSWMAMPWKRAKAKAAAIRADESHAQCAGVGPFIITADGGLGALSVSLDTKWRITMAILVL